MLDMVQTAPQVFFGTVRGRIWMKSLKMQLLAVGFALTTLCSAAWASFPTLSYDTVTAGTISAAAQTNTYTFSANANDILDFTVVTTSGSLLPCIQVTTYPAGTPVTNGGTCPGYGTIGLDGLSISSAGTYALTIRDFNNSNTGNYDIFLQRTDSPVGAVPLPLAQVQSGSIGSATQSNAYTFSANANDVFNFTLITTSGSLLPCMQIYNSAGAPVANGGTCPGYGTVGLSGFAVPSAGTYSVIIWDFHDAATGNYNIFQERTDGPPNPITLPFDTVSTGTISAEAQTNSYTFSANANDILDFTVVATSSTTGTLLPCIQVYTAAGAAVANGGTCPGYGTIGVSGLSIPTAGTYSLLIWDFHDSSTGDYNIFLQRTDNPVGSVSLPLGQVQTGNIGSATQSNAYTFSANVGDVFNFTMVTTSGNLLPCIEVYNSAGKPVASGSNCPGYGTIELNGVAVPSAGTYSAIVWDFHDAGTGNYSLFLERTNDPANPVNVDFDQTMSGAISAVAQSNAYTFAGTASDTLDYTVTTTSGGLLPCIWIYNSAGLPVTNGSSCPGYGTIELSGFSVPSSGTYFVILKDFHDASLGVYNMSVQCFGTCLLPAPTFTAMSPTSALAGSGGLTLTVTGSDFINNESNSVVQWNGIDLSTTWKSLTQMTAVIPASATAIAGIFPVTVFTPTPGGGTSSPIDFTVNNPVPTVTTTSPTSATAFGATFTLTVNGTGFVQGSEVEWNTYILATTYVSPTQLTAERPASDQDNAATAALTVFNSTPGGGTGGPVTFTITRATPTLTVTTSGTPSTYGNAVTFTATITRGTAGTITFYDGGTSIGTGTISGTTATLRTMTLGGGSHTITAAWAGDSNYYPVTSSAITQVMNKAYPTITWSAPAAITYGTA